MSKKNRSVIANDFTIETFLFDHFDGRSKKWIRKPAKVIRNATVLADDRADFDPRINDNPKVVRSSPILSDKTDRKGVRKITTVKTIYEVRGR